jgi:hypothetical protein
MPTPTGGHLALRHYTATTAVGLQGRENGMATSWLAFIGIAIALEIFVLLNMGKELIKTLKRIEAHMERGS